MIRQYEAEIEEKLMARMSLGEALDTFGNDLLIAATGAIAKKGIGPGGEVRVTDDGTNGVFLDYGIKIRDRIKFPGAPDIKAVLAELYDEGGSFATILFDVSKAHRRVPIVPEEWGRLACQVKGTAAATAQLKRTRATLQKDLADWRAIPLRRSDFTASEFAEEVFINKVGAFGVTSAGYWWGRAGGAIMRVGHYFVGEFDAIWASSTRTTASSRGGPTIRSAACRSSSL